MSLLPHSTLSPMPNTSVLKSIRLSSCKRRQYMILLYETIYALTKFSPFLETQNLCELPGSVFI